MKISDRINEVMEVFGENPASFSRKIGYDKPVKLYNYVKGIFEPKQDFYERVEASYPEVDTFWLKTGIGTMLKSGSALKLPNQPIDVEKEELKREVSELKLKIQVLEGILLRFLGK